MNDYIGFINALRTGMIRFSATVERYVNSVSIDIAGGTATINADIYAYKG